MPNPCIGDLVLVKIVYNNISDFTDPIPELANIICKVTNLYRGNLIEVAAASPIDIDGLKCDLWSSFLVRPEDLEIMFNV